MGIERFDRVPLLFGPSPVHRLERLSEHLGGAVDDLGEAGGLQLGPGVRRQQGAQARVPRRGGARAGLRHARLDRRRAVEPHPPGRGRRGTARPRLRARAGALGRVAGRRLRQGRQHPPLADHGRGRAARPVRLRHRHPQELGGRARVGRGERRQAVCDSGRRLRPPARRARLRALGRRGGRAGARARRLLRHDRRLLRDRIDAGRDDRRLRRAGAPSAPCSASTARRPSQQTWAQIARIARATAEAIELGRELDDSEIVLLDEWHAGTYGIPDEKTIDAIRLCARLEGVLTDPVYEGKSMAALIDLVQSGRIAPGSRVLYAHLGGQPALNAYAGAF